MTRRELCPAREEDRAIGFTNGVIVEKDLPRARDRVLAAAAAVLQDDREDRGAGS